MKTAPRRATRPDAIRDGQVLAFSRERDAVVVTLDADFHAILAVSGAGGPSVIRLRLQGLGAPEVVELVRHVRAGFEDELKRGSLVTVKPLKSMSHRLPIGTSE